MIYIISNYCFQQIKMKQIYTLSEAQALFKKKPKYGLGFLTNQRKPHNPKKAIPKTENLLCPELGKDNPYRFSEKALQKATAKFLQYFDVFKRRAFHVPNEREQEHTRIDLAAQGVKPGVSDWLILIAFEKDGVRFPGMAIELKNKTGSLSENQINFLNEMYNDGYYCAVCWNAESFEDLVRWAYLSKEK